MKSKNSTARLPQSLLEKLWEEQVDPRFNTSGHKRRGVSRKQLRQEARNTKKERKAANNVNRKHVQQQVTSADNAGTPPVPTSLLKPAISTTKRTAEDGPQAARKKRRVSFDVSSQSSTGVSRLVRGITSTHKSLGDGSGKSASKSADSEETNNPRSRPSKELVFKDRAEVEEERKINWLEKQLGLSSKGASRSKGRNKYSAEFEEDGLDDLLTSLDRIIDRTLSSNVDPPSLVISDDGEADHIPSSPEDIPDSMRAGSSEESGDDLSVMNDGGPLSDDISESSGDENGNHDSDDLPATVPLEAGNNPDTKESVGRYIPPHLRSRTDQRNAEVSAEIIKLKRQLKGLLNRVSEQNMATVLDDILALYRNNRRNDVTTTITDLLIDSISSHSQLLDSFVILHATLVASLHKLIGIDFAAHFVQESIACFENKYKLAVSAPEVANKPLDEVVDRSGNPDFDLTSIYSKESSNLIVLISELYNFQVISCVLVYDIIRLLLDGDNLTEISVELVLKIARNSGSQLRNDDPLALKDITELVLKKAGDRTRGMRQLSSRTRFMIDTLTNLKSGKSKSQTKAHAPGGESIQRLRKFLTGLEKKRHVLAREPLNVSLADLHSSDKRGKWWLVGAAWAGDPLVEAQKQREGKSTDQVTSSTKRASRMMSTEVSEEAVLQVARKQGMNTDVRRSIFVLLMSSEDYIDACERIRQLPLRDVQQGEIVRVLLHCCGNEKVYNPYYAMVGQQLAHTSQSPHRFAILLQFCLWDFLRGIGEDEVGGAGVLQNARDNGVTSEGSKDAPLVKIQNVASAYAWWTCRGITALSILKAVDFTNLKPQGQEFFKTFFIQLFLGIQTHSPVTSYHSSKPPNIPEEKDDKILADLFFKVAGQSTLLAQGLHYYFRQCHLEPEVKSEELKRLLEWSVDAAMRHLKEGLEAPAS